MRNLLFILLTIKIATTASNIRCITEVLQSYYKQQFKQVDTGELNGRLLAGSTSGDIQHMDNKPKFEIKTLEPIMIIHYVFVANLYSDIIQSGNKEYNFLVNKICVPYMLEHDIHVTPAQVHCNKLMRENLKEVKFMLKNSKLGQKIFGEMFKEAIKTFVNIYPVNRDQDSITMIRGKSEIDILQEKAVEYRATYDNTYKDIKKYFLKLFTKRIGQLVKTQMKSEFKITNIIENHNKDAKNTELAVLLPLATYYENIDYQMALSTAAIIKNIPSLIKDKPSNLTYLRLPELFLTKSNESYLFLTNYLHLKLGPSCYAFIVEKEIDQPVTTCQNLLNGMRFFENGEIDRFFRYASQSRTFLSELQNEIKKYIKNSGDVIYNISSFEDNLRAVRDKILHDKMGFIEKVDIGSDKSDNETALYLDLEDLLTTIPKKVNDYFKKHDEMTTYRNMLKSHYHFDETVNTYIQELKEKIKNFSHKKAEINTNEFIKKLKKKCRDNLSVKQANVCVFIADEIDFTALVPYRHYDYIFEVIVMNFQTEISSFDAESSAIDKLKEVMFHRMQNNVVDLKNEIDMKKQELSPDLNLKHKRVGNIVVAAIYGMYKSDKNWNYAIVPIISTWYNDKKKKVKIAPHHEDFLPYLEDLVDRILRKTEEPKLVTDIIKETLYEFTESEVEELKFDIETLVLHYNSWDKMLMDDMRRCELSSEVMNEVHAKCEVESQARNSYCQIFNPFVLIQGCSSGYSPNQRECIADCPMGFIALNDTYCLKPAISSIKDHKNPKADCEYLHRRVAHLCIPACPLGWEDHGSHCLRPRYHNKHYLLIA